MEQGGMVFKGAAAAASAAASASATTMEGGSCSRESSGDATTSISIDIPPPPAVAPAQFGYGRHSLAAADHHHHHRRHGSHSSLVAGGPTTPTGAVARTVSQSFVLLDLVRALSAQNEGLNYCQICREYEAAAATFRLAACSHRFCRECLASYLTAKIDEGQTKPTCFFIAEPEAVLRQQDDARIPKPCGVPVAEADIQELVSAATFAKWQRFCFNKQHHNARPCPYCDSLELGDPAVPEMVCSVCGKEFCYFHSSAHAAKGLSCIEYERLMHEENLKNQALISLISKPCPGCSSPVEKAGGCNQMKCHTCGSHFCWLCGKQVDGSSFPGHFQWWNLNGCPNMQMQESAAPPPASYVRMMRIASGIQTLLLGPIALVLGIAGYILFLPCFLMTWCHTRDVQPLKSHFTGCISFCGNMLLALCFIPAILVLLVVFLFSTFMQVCVASAVSRFGCCCCYADNAAAIAAEGSTTRPWASTPPIPASGGGQEGNRQQVLQQMREAHTLTTERRRSAPCCVSRAFPPAPASGLEALAMMASVLGSSGSSSGSGDRDGGNGGGATAEMGCGNGMTAPPLQEIRTEE